MSLQTRLARMYGADEGWVRPVNVRTALRVDILGSVLLAALAALSVESSRSLGALNVQAVHGGFSYAWVVLAPLTLALRRVRPVLTLAIAMAHFMITAFVFPELTPVFVLQIYYFFSLFSCVAWAANRLHALWMTELMALVTTAWVVADVWLNDRMAAIAQMPMSGLLPPEVAAVVQIVISTATFLFTSAIAGVTTWWSARREAMATLQGRIIASQAEDLRQESVSRVRMRVARELHDVVGHHIAVIGIQSAAARSVLKKQPQEAESAMRIVEQSSRTAAQDLRLLLGALRVDAEFDSDSDLRESLDQLIATVSSLGLHVNSEITGCLEDLPAHVTGPVHRIVQEALTNVLRHSTATSVDVTIRATASCVHARVFDPGPAREGTSGSQLGLTGMHERVQVLHGRWEAGPLDSGFVVEVDLPTTEETQ